MLPCQRHLFDIPRDICYFNAAAWSPLPLASRDAGQNGVLRKVHPWEMRPDDAARQIERARAAAGRLINADPQDVAVISSVGYGVATAGRVLPLPTGSRVLVLQDDHTSPVLEWMGRTRTAGAELDIVRRPENGDWTQAVLNAITRPGSPPVALASFSAVHWSDGGLMDLDRIMPALRTAGAPIVLDATHAAGVMPIDVKTLDPDFLIFPTYKWILGPYGRAFLYVAKRWQQGTPLEQTGGGRRRVNSESSPYISDPNYVANATRFDMGERDHFITLEMAAIGMEMMVGWGAPAISERLLMLTRLLADELRNTGVRLPHEHLRAPHILSLEFPNGMPSDLSIRLPAQRVYASPRLGRLRISPHVYNDEHDIDRFISVFREAYTVGSHVPATA
jgi:selenocysteine lyase/cysteine desulfurase